MKANQLIILLITTCITINAFAAKPPPKPANDLDCIGCVDTVDIATQAVTTEKLSQDVQDTLQKANLNDTRITINSTDIQTNVFNIGVNTADVQTNATDINTNANNIQTNTSAIDGVLASKNISVFADGVRIGSFLLYQLSNAPQFVYILSDTNYTVELLPTGGSPVTGILGSYFLTNDCSGQSYTNISPPFFSTQGYVFSTNGNDPVAHRYVPSGQPVETIATLSAIFTGSCTSYTQTLIARKTFPNDPSVTGFQNSIFDATVITVGY